MNEVFTVVARKEIAVMNVQIFSLSDHVSLTFCSITCSLFVVASSSEFIFFRLHPFQNFSLTSIKSFYRAKRYAEGTAIEP